MARAPSARRTYRSGSLSASLKRWALLGVCASGLSAAPVSAWALLTGELADRVADYLAIFVIVIVPIAGIYLFWKVHVLPEQIAEKRQHPQKEAIHVLCLLSLVFGGMLWPIAWLWAYTKPTLHKLAYGTDKHEDAERLPTAEPEIKTTTSPGSELQDRLVALRDAVDRFSDQDAPKEDIALLKRDIARIEKKLAPTTRPGAH